MLELGPSVETKECRRPMCPGEMSPFFVDIRIGVDVAEVTQSVHEL